MEDIKKYSEELSQILTKKSQDLDQILKLTELQTKAIEAEDTDELNRLIDKKQTHIDGIDRLDEKFVEKIDLLKAVLGVKALDEISGEKAENFKQIKAQIGGINKQVEQIFSIEKENSVKIKEEYDEVKNKLKEISGGKKALTAYGGKPISNGGAFFDKKK